MSISQVFLGPVTSCGHVLDPSHPPFQNSYWSLSQQLLRGTTFTWTASLLRTPLELPAPFNWAFQSLNPKATPLPQFCHYPSILIHCYPPMPPAPTPGSHGPPPPDMVSDGFLSHQESHRSSGLSCDHGLQAWNAQEQMGCPMWSLRNLLYGVEMW